MSRRVYSFPGGPRLTLWVLSRSEGADHHHLPVVFVVCGIGLDKPPLASGFHGFGSVECPFV